ncbi:hypothetical protein PG997_012462 [Apiospora hydei]|uniref:Uncharacterized protein n=1 Tax=Apiospora hydei TaxID=1337664 RepID=A0ABR1V3F4_9PEZI
MGARGYDPRTSPWDRGPSQRRSRGPWILGWRKMHNTDLVVVAMVALARAALGVASMGHDDWWC